MSQRESNAENVSIWWRHHEFSDVPGNPFLPRAFLNQWGFNPFIVYFCGLIQHKFQQDDNVTIPEPLNIQFQESTALTMTVSSHPL